MRKAFKITSTGGFHLTFENGVTLSTQFNPGTYSDNHDKIFSRGGSLMDVFSELQESNTVEIMVWDQDHDVITAYIMQCLGEDDYEDEIKGYVTLNEWLEIVQECISFHPTLCNDGKNK